jgi:hypothetical protein
MLLRALGASATKAERQRLRGAGAGIATGLAALVVTLGVSACGGGERQDVTEPSGNFPVQVTKAKFPNEQRLAQTSDLELAVKNVGDKTIPDLAVTIYTGDAKADGSFNVRLSETDLANPNRPVWILENGYPKLLAPGATTKRLGRVPSAGAAAAQTDTFQFGALPAGQSKDAVWRVTPVRSGTYTVHYEVAAGLQGKAKAVTSDGSPVKDQFAVTVTSKPPQTCVNGAGQVTTGCGP